MPSNIYVLAAEPDSGKTAVALSLFDAMIRRVKKVAVFRPIVAPPALDDPRADPVLDLLYSQYPIALAPERAVGVVYSDAHKDMSAAIGTIVERYRALASEADAVLVVGSDFVDVVGPTELQFNAQVAVNLGANVAVVQPCSGLTPDEVAAAFAVTGRVLEQEHCSTLARIACRVAPDQLDAVTAAVSAIDQAPVYAVPQSPILSAPTLDQLRQACDGRLILGDESLLQREAQGFLVAAMTLPHVLDRLTENAVVISPSDRGELLIGALVAQASDAFPPLAGVILSGGLEPPEQIVRLAAGLGSRMPVILSPLDTYRTARICSQVRGTITSATPRKIELALDTYGKYIDSDRILADVELHRSDVVTPLMFENDLLARARSNRKRIVLPEGDEPRILAAVDQLLRKDVVDLILLGDRSEIRARAAELGLVIDGAEIIDPNDETLLDRFAEEYARLRAHKGVTAEQARDVVTDVSYFGTMMVQLGLADGMVSGAVHTTAHTIRPSFEIIKTLPGTLVVSSVFFMCLEDRVLVYGDCAVNPDPTAEQLADIAINSAVTSRKFGIDPRIAMLSYSTGESGSGAGVDKVRQATELARERDPELIIEGPIQYDAAVDMSVAKTKLPDSQVAGRATVFIFPDLNTGNNTYKAVQRSAGAVAVGPVLQGLRKPVNDLSRGALVRDIVTTVVITAIQAAD